MRGSAAAFVLAAGAAAVQQDCPRRELPEDPKVYRVVRDGFLKHLEKVTGKKVALFPL